LDLPTLLVGGGAGAMKGNRHIKAAPQTPMANLMLSLTEKFGIEAESFGISTGRVEI
jgi:hypothetical protein